MDDPAPSFVDHFAAVPDPRVVGRCAHKLFDILFIAVVAFISRCDDWEMVALWARERESWLRKYCELPGGIPSHDTFTRVFSCIDPEALRIAFASWMADVEAITAGSVVAVDGKTLRRAFARAGDGKGAIHMVSAWLTENRVVLGQLKVEAKSNEITAIPELLRLLELKGALVTIDAMGCQKDIAEQIVEQGADYLLAVKENQPTLLEDVKRTFEEAPRQALRHVKTVDEGHGRLEIREYYQCADLSKLRTATDWPGLRSVGMVVSHRFVGPDQNSTETRYYISSLNLGVKRMAKGIRSHWGIENQLHYVLDVSFDEDHNRTRAGNGAENMAIARHAAMNFLQAATHLKVGIKNRRNLAAISTKILEKILQI